MREIAFVYGGFFLGLRTGFQNEDQRARPRSDTRVSSAEPVDYAVASHRNKPRNRDVRR